MKITDVAIEKINPAPYNPRKTLRPGDQDYESLKRGIEEFDLVQPLVVNKKNDVLVGGHQRLRVLKDLGWKTAPCVLVHIDDPKREKALNLALNKIGEGGWDNAKLGEILTELDAASFDIQLTGYSTDELERILGGG